MGGVIVPRHIVLSLSTYFLHTLVFENLRDYTPPEFEPMLYLEGESEGGRE